MRYRRVWHVVVAYTVVAVGFLELADLTLDAFSGPPIVLTWLFFAVLGGFPIAVACAWVFDFTSAGIKRTRPKESEPISQSSTTLIMLVVFSVAVSGATGWFVASQTTSKSNIAAMVVLPLRNLTGQPDQDYFVDGIHEALIGELARLSGINVVSRTSAMQYRDTDKSLKQIGAELGVEAVVEGSVLRTGDHVTVSAKLLGVEQERNLWSGQYQRAADEIATLQRDVVLSIAREIELSLTPGDRKRLTTTTQVDARAYDDLLRGRALWRNQTAEDTERAIGLFNSALVYEPEYADAYASLAEAYMSLSWIVQNPLMPDQVFPRAKAAAHRALEIDPTLADAYMALGLVAWRHDFDAGIAEQSFGRAVALEPSNAEALHWYALFLATRERWTDAEAMIDRALELDPLSLLITANRGWIQYFAGNAAEALTIAASANQLWPQSGIPYYHKGVALLQLDRSAEAIEAFRGAIDRSGRLPYLLAALGNALAKNGRIADAEAILAELLQRNYTAPYLIAMVELGLGRRGAALDRLEAAVSIRDAYLSFLAVEPIWKPLEGEDRFFHIREQAGHGPRRSEDTQ